jgi:UBX domain-containing protein 11
MDPLPIGFYKNGISLKGYPFYVYGSNDACHILADILDGYFPYLLKNKYPKGTLMKIIDKMDDIYEVDDKQKYDIMSIDEKAL